MRTATKRRRALLLALLYALMLLLAIGVMLAETGHQCPGIDCTVCRTILTLHALLLQIAAFLVLLRAAWLARPLCHKEATGLTRRPLSRTPVALCTRMND